MNTSWKPDLYNKNVSYVYELAAPLIDLLEPKPGERVLDLGCGTGELTKALADAGCSVVGVDASSAMVEVAKEKGLEAYVVDGHDLDFDNEFDAVFSNSALHWMKKDPRRVIRNIKRSLKPNGRLVAEFGGKGSVDSILKAVKFALEKRGISFENVNPLYYPAAEEYAALLEAEGMKVDSIEIFPRKTPVPSGPIGILKVFGHGFFRNMTEAEKEKIYEEVETAMKPLDVDQNGVFLQDNVRLRVLATKVNEH